jgi:DNA-binding beta-propeller fold protein YncE
MTLASRIAGGRPHAGSGRLAVATALSALLTGLAAGPAQADTAVQVHRTLVADAQNGTVTVFETDSGQVLARYTLAGPARLHHSPSGRHALAVMGAAGQVRVVDTGVAVDDHGDHSDVAVSAPALLDVQLAGPKPSHVNSGDGRVVVFFDGDGTSHAIPEAALAKGDLGQTSVIRTGTGHHGVAKPLAGMIAVSVPQAGETLPVAIAIAAPDGALSQNVPCPRLHGEGRSARFTAFGCADGIAVYEEGKAGVTARHLPYPASLPAGRMVRNLRGAGGFALLVGDFGPDGMVAIDPTRADGFTFLPLPARRMAFDLDAGGSDRLFVLLEDGQLLVINALTGATERQAAVTGRYSMEQGVIRPRMVVRAGRVLVTDPARGEVVVLDAATLAERRRLAVGGTPGDVLAVGATGHKH